MYYTLARYHRYVSGGDLVLNVVLCLLKCSKIPGEFWVYRVNVHIPLVDLVERWILISKSGLVCLVPCAGPV